MATDVGRKVASHSDALLSAHGQDQGLLLLELDGTVLAITSAARRSLGRCSEVMLLQTGGTGEPAWHLGFRLSSHRERFNQVARTCAEDPDNGVRALNLEFGTRQPALILNLSRAEAGAGEATGLSGLARTGRHRFRARPPRLLGVLVDRALELRIHPQILHEVFALTQSESRVAQAYLTLDTMSEVAQLLGISVNTVKKHLASIYIKMRCSRQAQLVRLLMSLAQPGQSEEPPVRPHPHGR